MVTRCQFYPGNMGATECMIGAVSVQTFAAFVIPEGL